MPLNVQPLQCPYCPRQPRGPLAMKAHIRGSHKNKSIPHSFAPATQTPSPELTTPSTAEPIHALPESLAPSSATPHIITKDIKPDSKGRLHCPECDYIVQNADRKRLGRHRRFTHGVIGFKHNNEIPNGTPHRRIGRPPKSKNTEKGLVHVPHSPLHLQSSSASANGAEIDPIAYGIAVGKVEELCLRFAAEHDFPPRLFARNVAELFLRQARR